MKFFYSIALALSISLFISCSPSDQDDKTEKFLSEDVANSPDKDAYIQRYNLKQMKKFAAERSECDTISLMEFVLDYFPEGTYLVETDKTSSYSLPKPAVIYFTNEPGYIFGVVVKSREGERLIETKNIIGYDQSFIDLDSTDLGTAFFYLTLFNCNENKFNVVWETPIPSHGGFNNIAVKSWKNNIKYVQVNFHYGQGIGHINYNYFLIDGLKKEPHLLMTYKGINFKRTITDLNKDNFPDYYEHLYYDLGDKIYSKDSVAFIWKQDTNVYVNTRNSKQTRQY